MPTNPTAVTIAHHQGLIGVSEFPATSDADPTAKTSDAAAPYRCQSMRFIKTQTPDALSLPNFQVHNFWLYIVFSDQTTIGFNLSGSSPSVLIAPSSFS